MLMHFQFRVELAEGFLKIGTPEAPGSVACERSVVSLQENAEGLVVLRNC